MLLDFALDLQSPDDPTMGPVFQGTFTLGVQVVTNV